MDGWLALIGIIAVLIGFYLVMALLGPERFE